VKKPADTVTLSAEDGEALSARGHQSHLGTEDAGVGEWVIRRYFGVAFTLQEATLSVQRLRTMFCGRGDKGKTPPGAQSAAPSREALDEGEEEGEPAPVEEHAAGVEAVV
jgi:hypothetical protein